MKTFVKANQLNLVNGGYLVTGEKETPVTHPEFLEAQAKAEYVVKMAELAEGKTFEAAKVDSVEDLKAEVEKALATKATQYVDVPKEPAQEINEKLAEEALAFIGYQEDKAVADNINDYMQQFNVLNDFEKFGLYFDEGIVKLNRIYTVKEIQEAVTAIIDILER